MGAFQNDIDYALCTEASAFHPSIPFRICPCGTEPKEQISVWYLIWNNSAPIRGTQNIPILNIHRQILRFAANTITVLPQDLLFEEASIAQNNERISIFQEDIIHDGKALMGHLFNLKSGPRNWELHKENYGSPEHT